MTIQEIIKKKSGMYKYFTEIESLEAVKQNGCALQFVKNQTENICLEAVKQDGYALQYVKEQTENICLEAVKQDSKALKYVNEHLFTIAPKKLTIAQITELLGYDIVLIE